MVTMSRAEILEQLPSRPSEHAKAAALRALWQPSVRDLEIVRLHTEEGLSFNSSFRSQHGSKGTPLVECGC